MRSVVCITLMPAHKSARLSWSLAQWANVMLTDESRFNRQMTIRRKRRTCFHPENITESHNFSRGVLVWAGFMLDSCTNLHIFEPWSVTAAWNKDKVLELYVSGCCRSRIQIPGFRFRNDKALSHRIVLGDNFLKSKNIQHMQCPTYSPDLNLSVMRAKCSEDNFQLF